MNGGVRILSGILLMLGLLTGPALAGTLTGKARLLDGDTIEISGQVIRLHGIDAPETSQRCFDARNRAYACGVEALDGLRALIGGAKVTCTGSEHDRYDRLIATCTARGRDLNRTMVAQGLAVAFRRFSDDYLPEELEALKAARGIWQGQFERPYLERERRWSDAVSQSPNGCPIKGNISNRGRIYHTPYSRHYAKTRINTSKGERWFCSEAEALAAGWRAPYR
jgi:endonuclease YncB( thermonuclease family)